MFEKLQQASRLNDNGAYPLPAHPPDEHRADRRHAGAPAAGGPRRRAARTGLEHAMMAGTRPGAVQSGGVDALRSYAHAWRSPAHGRAGAQAAPCTPPRWPAPSCATAGGAAQVRGQARRADGGGRRATRLRGCWPPNSRWPPAMVPARLPWPDVHARPPRNAAVRRRRRSPADRAADVGAAFADMGGPASARRAGLAAAGGRLYGAGTVSCAPCAPKPRRRWRTWITRPRCDRFKAAQDMARKGGPGTSDHIEASIIDTRARQVESLLREQALER